MPRRTTVRLRVPDPPAPSAAGGFSAYARLLEEAATTASIEAGYAPRWYAAEGTAWVIRRSTIECEAPIAPGTAVEVATWVADFRRVRSRREYEMRAEPGGPPLLRAHTDWVYVERASGRPRRIPAPMMSRFVPEGAAEALPREPLETGARPADAASIEQVVVPADVDALDHMNNARYFDYVEQAIRAALAATPAAHRRPVRHDQEYLEEARNGDRLACFAWRLREGECETEVATEIRRAADGAALARARSLCR
ncbi:MAG: hypothetical protein HYY35_01500 [Deltaproteobacteria bacterium]|nr:hypothetical protein [Deltaproteobacteria bacterium]